MLMLGVWDDFAIQTYSFDVAACILNFENHVEYKVAWELIYAPHIHTRTFEDKKNEIQRKMCDNSWQKLKQKVKAPSNGFAC